MAPQLSSPKNWADPDFRPIFIFAKRLDAPRGLIPGNFVLDGDPASPPLKGHSHPICDQCLLWPNDWMDEDATWYGSRPRPRPHCIRRSPSSARKGHSSPPSLSAHVCCGHGRPSQLLLSSCLNVLCYPIAYFIY